MNLLDRITRKGRAYILAYDHGLEYGPIEFNDKNVDPVDLLVTREKRGQKKIISDRKWMTFRSWLSKPIRVLVIKF